MNIVPELNLNKHPNTATNNSIVYAENMMLSEDGAVLQTEPQYVVNTDILDTLPKETYPYGPDVIYALPCNEEILFFIRPFTADGSKAKVLDILRYNEVTKQAKIVLDNFEYNGGTLLGGFTYSKNNLIVTISEYFDSPNSKGYKAVPLRVINLGSDISQSEYINNSDIHSLVPKVIIPTIENEYINGRAYKGWYYIFIRYKIDEHDYTQWYNTNKCLFVDEFEDTKILSYYIDKNLKVGESTIGENYETENNLIISNANDLVNISFISKIVANYDNKYNAYQLGFICISKTYTKAFKTADLDKTTSTIVFSNENVDEYSASELIKSYYNYYNVKSLDIVNNRIYIGNFNNNDNQKDIILPNNITAVSDDGETIIEPFDIVSLDNKFNEYSNNEVEIYKTAKVTLNYDDKKFVENLKIIRINDKDVWYLDASNFYFAFTLINYPVKNSVTEETTIQVTYEYEMPAGGTGRLTFTSQAKHLIYVFDETIGGYYNINNGIIKINCKEDILIINKIGDVAVDGDNLIFIMPFFEYSIEENSHINRIINSINILKSNGILPESYYNFYIHFIDEYGASTNGIPIKKYTSGTFTTNHFLTLEGKYNGDNLFGYKGFFISYEKFEPSILLKGIAKVDATNKKLIVYNDQLNYNDSINLSFDKITLFKVKTKEIVNLNKNLDLDLDNFETYDVISKKLNPADSPNNILKSTNLELEINIENIADLSDDEYIAYLYREDDSLLYKSENKTLIPCSDIIYDITKPFIVNTRNSFNTTIFALVYENKTIFDDATKVYKYISLLTGTGWINKEPFYIYKFKDFLEVPNESIAFNNAPLNVFYLAGINGDNTNNSLYPGRVVDVRNTIDLFKQPQVRVYDLYPKILNWRNPNVKYENEFNKTIRRSHVIQDESNNNAWRLFETEEYRNIHENKGNIIKLIGIGKYFIVHTEYSMFLFNGTDTIKSNEGEIQLSSVDILNLNYQEVITSKLGFAGIRKEHHGIVGSFGYIFFDKDAKIIYQYDNNRINIIDGSVTNLIHNNNTTDVIFGDDKVRNRLFILLKGNKTYLLSFNYKINKFISLHSVNEENLNTYNFFTTKNIFYLTNEVSKFYPLDRVTVVKKYIYTIDNNFYSDGKISIIHNDNYELMKYLDNILYKVNLVKENTDITPYPVEGRNTYYAGDGLQIISEHCDTGLIELYRGDITNINKITDYKVPYWRFGNWHFNAIRNKLNENIPADEKSRVFGNWFVITFEFKPVGNEKIEIESLECKTSIAEY